MEEVYLVCLKRCLKVFQGCHKLQPNKLAHLLLPALLHVITSHLVGSSALISARSKKAL